MSDEELEVLITVDDPWYGPEEDNFHQTSRKDAADGNYNEKMLFAFV